MKFQLIIEEGGNTLLLRPENSGESQILASICDPNAVEPENVKTATIKVEYTSDRPPYRKVTALKVMM